MKLGIENRKQIIAAAVLGVFLLLLVVYQFMPSSSTIASTAPGNSTLAGDAPGKKTHSLVRRNSTPAGAKKDRRPQSLDPTLNLAQLAASEQIKYQGSGRNIFVSQPDAVIPTPVASGVIGSKDPNNTYQIPSVAAPPPIPLKFFGFASKKGEPKKIFLSKGEDVFIAGEGEVVDRRYKVIRITPTSVDIQDVVGSGPPQTIPLTLG